MMLTDAMILMGEPQFSVIWWSEMKPNNRYKLCFSVNNLHFFNLLGS